MIHPVYLSDEEVSRCADYGARLARVILDRHIKLGPRDQLRDPEVQASGRRCELAVARLLGAGIEDLMWEVGPDVFDPGHDFIIDVGSTTYSIDVKGSTHPRAKLLIIPVGKTHLPMASVYVLSRSTVEEPGLVEVIGWQSRAWLKDNLLTAGPGDPYNLVPGTKYTEALRDIGELQTIIHTQRHEYGGAENVHPTETRSTG